jgi:hypothetical protein
MTEPRFDVQDKIAKLLAKAEKTTPEEALVLTEAAERMMLKYGIEQAVINAKRAGSDHASDERIIRVIIQLKGTYRRALLLTLGNIADAFGTVKTINGHTRDSTEFLWLVGYESDVRQVETLVTSLHLQLMAALSTWWRTFDADGMTAMAKFKARRQFMLSFGSGACARIAASRREAVADATNAEPGTALVLRDRRSAVTSWVDAQYELVPGKSVRMASGGYAAGSAGYEAGRNASTGEGALKATKAIR